MFQSHTADEKFTVKADTLEHAFITAVDACKQIMIGKMDVQPEKLHKVTIVSERLRSLLYDFLNEIIAHLDEEHVLLTDATELTILKAEKYELTATLVGVSADEVDFRTVIKNMTYSEMVIDESDDGVELTVVVDI